ncbi:MAG: hypothetical protein IE931_09735 [Sphingobacteriales bacterium]|nr:hypothetical protein [Sphingobacteriales bacterium]
MKTKKLIIGLLSSLIVTATLSSCSKSKNSTPAGMLQLHFNTVNNSIILGKQTNGTLGIVPNLEITSGFMNVTSVGLDHVSGEIERHASNENLSMREDTSSIVEFFVPNQKILNVNINSGNYSNVKIRVDISQTLTHSALFLKGNFKNSIGNVIPLEFSLNEGDLRSNFNNEQNGEYHGGQNDGLELSALANSLYVDTQNIATVVISLDFKLLFEGIHTSDLESAKLTNGTLIINKNLNQTIYNQIKSNINKFSKID